VAPGGASSSCTSDGVLVNPDTIGAMHMVRFAFVLISANAATGFVNFIYQVTDPLVAPFRNIVNTPGFDMGAIIAIFVYMIAGWLIITLFRLFFSDTNRLRQTTQVDIER
jgi:uncharacterized protein YggT (Ycf19 family)